MAQDVNSMQEEKLQQIEETILPGIEEAGQEQTCRICGCTWEYGCPSGCWWVERDLCSVCVGKAYPEGMP